MIELGYTGTCVRLESEGVVIRVKAIPGSSQPALEDSISQVFKASAISHKVRGFTTLEYSRPTRLYVEKEGSALSIESECGTTAEMSGSLMELSKLLRVAGVPFEN